MKCDECGKKLKIGDWPWCPHEALKPGELWQFKPYFDYGLGQVVTSYAEKKKLMKAAQADYRQVGAGMPGCEI